MGKTAAGAVWLNERQLSAYDYWQFWRNTEDADVARFLKLFTTLPMQEIAKLAALGGAEINEAKKALATEATALSTAGKKPRRRPKRRARRSSRVRCVRSADSRDRSQRPRGGHWRSDSVREGGPRCLERRGAPANSRRRFKDQ